MTLWLVTYRLNDEVIYQSFTSLSRAMIELMQLRERDLDPTLHVKEVSYAHSN